MTTATLTPTSTIPAIAVPLPSLAAFGSGMSMRVTDPLLSLLSREFGVAIGHASLVVTVFAVTYGLAQLLFGPLVAHVGTAAILAGGAVAVLAVALNFSRLLRARAGLSLQPATIERIWSLR